MRPARAAAENTPAKPGRQPSFSQSATVPLEPEPCLASSTEVPRPRRSQKLQSRSRTSGPDQTMTPAARRLPVIDENDEFAQHSTQSRSAPSIALATAISHREWSQMRPARAAAENKNTTRSSSAPKKKLSGASLFLAEMVRRRMVRETG